MGASTVEVDGRISDKHANEMIKWVKELIPVAVGFAYTGVVSEVNELTALRPHVLLQAETAADALDNAALSNCDSLLVTDAHIARAKSESVSAFSKTLWEQVTQEPRYASRGAAFTEAVRQFMDDLAIDSPADFEMLRRLEREIHLRKHEGGRFLENEEVVTFTGLIGRLLSAGDKPVTVDELANSYLDQPGKQIHSTMMA